MPVFQVRRYEGGVSLDDGYFDVEAANERSAAEKATERVGLLDVGVRSRLRAKVILSGIETIFYDPAGTPLPFLPRRAV